MSWGGLRAAEAAAATVSVLGAIVTLTMLPETMGMSLEELNAEAETAQPVGA
jgi:MFS transporter, PHS family, inorganic phosphate transporter